MVCFSLQHRNDDIREIGLCGNTVMFRGNGRMVRMRMINAQQQKIFFHGISLAQQIVFCTDFKPPPFVAGFRISHFSDFLNKAGSCCGFDSVQKTTTFIGKYSAGMVQHQAGGYGLKTDHENIFFNMSPYLSPLSGRTVTTTPFSSSEATRMAPTRLAAEEGLSRSPSCSLAFRIISQDSSVPISRFLSARPGS